MHFLFRLDLSLHAGVEIFFGILIYATKHGLSAPPISHPPTTGTKLSAFSPVGQCGASTIIILPVHDFLLG